jgi:hypothetical protein
MIFSFILANTEQLHTKIGEMGDRIKTLEDALREVQISGSPHPHPLLAPDLLAIKSALALYGDTQTGSQQDSRQQEPPPLRNDSNGNASQLNNFNVSRQVQVNHVCDVQLDPKAAKPLTLPAYLRILLTTPTPKLPAKFRDWVMSSHFPTRFLPRHVLRCARVFAKNYPSALTPLTYGSKFGSMPFGSAYLFVSPSVL